jgi:hypothetical protein
MLRKLRKLNPSFIPLRQSCNRSREQVVEHTVLLSSQLLSFHSYGPQGRYMTETIYEEIIKQSNHALTVNWTAIQAIKT